MSRYKNYCDGYKSPAPNGNGYLVSPVLSVGKVSEKFYHPGSKILDSILAYDKAETTSAYLGQINMTTVSSFVGINGAIWGYDFVSPDDLRKKYAASWKFLKKGSKKIPVYDLSPLQEASKEVWGTLSRKHFPFLPGSHVPCAGKYYTKEGPSEIYGAMAIGIPEKRSGSAALIMEDTGEMKGENSKDLEQKIIRNISESVLEIGKIQKINYKEIFTGFKSIKLSNEEIGCALVVMPYFYLAQNAYLSGTEELLSLDLKEWKRKAKSFYK